MSVLNGNFLVTWLDLQPDPANSTLKGAFLQLDRDPTSGRYTRMLTADPVTGKLPYSAGPVARGADAFYLISRALPVPLDPEAAAT